MEILPLNNETLDGFLLKSQEIHKEAIQRALERYDKDIYCSIDRKRFVLIRLDERTILSSYGILRFKRRYYYDSFMGEYCYLLDNRLRIPKSKRMTSELILRILDLASIMSYKEVGEHLSNEFVISKYTVWKTINEALLETYFDVDMDRKDLKIHVQREKRSEKGSAKRSYEMMRLLASLKSGSLLSNATPEPIAIINVLFVAKTTRRTYEIGRKRFKLNAKFIRVVPDDSIEAKRIDAFVVNFPPFCPCAENADGPLINTFVFFRKFIQQPFCLANRG